MHIHLFISKFAPAANRLRAALQDSLSALPTIQYDNVEAIGRVIPAPYKEKAIAVVMVAGNEELEKLAEKNHFWDRVKTILILPNSHPETISMGHALQPRFVTFVEHDFKDVIAVLNHMHANDREDSHSSKVATSHSMKLVEKAPEIDSFSPQELAMSIHEKGF